MMQQDHTTSLNLIMLQDKELKKLEERRDFWLGPQTNVSLKVPRACPCERKNKKNKTAWVRKESSNRASKVGNHHNVVGQNGVHRKALKS